MQDAITTLLRTLSETPGNTVEERMETLIRSGTIFTPNLDAMRTVARRLDSSLTNGYGGWVHMAAFDIEAAKLSKRLATIGTDAPPAKIRANPGYYSERFVAECEHLYQRTRLPPEQPFRRRRRVSEI